MGLHIHHLWDSAGCVARRYHDADGAALGGLGARAGPALDDLVHPDAVGILRHRLCEEAGGVQQLLGFLKFLAGYVGHDELGRPGTTDEVTRAPAGNLVPSKGRWVKMVPGG